MQTRATIVGAGRAPSELHSGVVVEGPTRITLTVGSGGLPRDALPLYVREGSASARVAAREVATVADVAKAPLVQARARSGAEVEVAREGTFASSHTKTTLRVQRVDHAPASVTAASPTHPGRPRRSHRSSRAGFGARDMLGPCSRRRGAHRLEVPASEP